MIPDRHCETCGKDYWHNQQWIHDKCVVANTKKKVANKAVMVANSVVTTVANKHGVYKDKESRLKYMRDLMRKRRATEKVAH